jgi:hypothetical protein
MKHIPLAAIGRPLSVLTRQPQWIAVFLSVGFHGALFAASPSFSSLNMAALGGNVPQPERREVPLIELTPEEQNRLPDFSSSAFSPFGDDGPFSLLPPSSSPPSLGDLTPPQRMPQPSASPSPFGSSSSLLPGISPYRSSRSAPSRSTIRLPSGISPMRVTPPASQQPRPTLPQPDSQETSVESSPESSAENPTVDPSTGTAADLLPRVAVNQAASELAPGDSDAPADGNDTPETAASGDSTPAPAAAELPEQLAAFVYDETGTSDDEIAAALETWQAAAQEQFPGELTTAEEPLTITVPYDGNICLSPEPAQGLLGLVLLPVATEAEAVSLSLSTTVLKSTGYSFLNEAAVSSLNNLEADAIQPGVLYQAEVDVAYNSDDCTSPQDLLDSVTTAPATTPTPAPPRTSPAPTTPAANPPEAAPEAAVPLATDSNTVDDSSTVDDGNVVEERQESDNGDATNPANSPSQSLE